MANITRWSRNSILHTSWYNFAVDLVGKSSADTIWATYFGGGSHSALQRMLTLWFNSTNDRSWKMIIDALKQMNEYRVIESIEDECQLSVCSS